MKSNLGNIDKVIRVIIAIAIAALYFTNTITGTPAIIGMVVAVIFVLTSLVGTCPIYLALGLSTNKKSA